MMNVFADEKGIFADFTVELFCNVNDKNREEFCFMISAPYHNAKCCFIPKDWNDRNIYSVHNVCEKLDIFFSEINTPFPTFLNIKHALIRCNFDK